MGAIMHTGAVGKCWGRKEGSQLRKVAFNCIPYRHAGARAFYEEVLGLPPSRNGTQSPWVEFDLPGGGCLAITTVTDDKPGGGTIAFEVDDLDETVAELKSKGVAFAAEGIESPVCHMAVVKDPDGNAIIAQIEARDVSRARRRCLARGARNRGRRSGMARYGIVASKVFGVSVANSCARQADGARPRTGGRTVADRLV